jgi:hypothetical protein
MRATWPTEWYELTPGLGLLKGYVNIRTHGNTTMKPR